MTTDLRAALREAVLILSDPVLRNDENTRAVASERFRTLADAQPAVAERMPVTWFDAHRSASYILACITIAGTTLDVIGDRRRTGEWLWTWRADIGAIGNGTATDEASAKAAALAAFDEWIAEIVDARRAVTP